MDSAQTEPPKDKPNRDTSKNEPKVELDQRLSTDVKNNIDTS